jgi:dsRNA-specific ribonuclease
VNGKKYYFWARTQNGHKLNEAAVGVKSINGTFYLFTDDGQLRYGLNEHHGKMFYTDSKGRLQEILQQNGGETPSYRITGTSGPPHAPVFEAAVFRGDREIGRGTGKTKKQAEQAAAMAALNRLEKKDETETNSDKR